MVRFPWLSKEFKSHHLTFLVTHMCPFTPARLSLSCAVKAQQLSFEELHAMLLIEAEANSERKFGWVWWSQGGFWKFSCAKGTVACSKAVVQNLHHLGVYMHRSVHVSGTWLEWMEAMVSWWNARCTYTSWRMPAHYVDLGIIPSCGMTAAVVLMLSPEAVCFLEITDSCVDPVHEYLECLCHDCSHTQKCLGLQEKGDENGSVSVSDVWQDFVDLGLFPVLRFSLSFWLFR